MSSFTLFHFFTDRSPYFSIFTMVFLADFATFDTVGNTVIPFGNFTNGFASIFPAALRPRKKYMITKVIPML